MLRSKKKFAKLFIDTKATWYGSGDVHKDGEHGVQSVFCDLSKVEVLVGYLTTHNISFCVLEINDQNNIEDFQIPKTPMNYLVLSYSPSSKDKITYPVWREKALLKARKTFDDSGRDKDGLNRDVRPWAKRLNLETIPPENGPGQVKVHGDLDFGFTELDGDNYSIKIEYGTPPKKKTWASYLKGGK